MFRKFRAFEASPTIEFRDPDTGHIYKAQTLTELYKNIVMYRLQNKLEPIELLRETVETYLCSLPENANKCQGVEMQRSVMTYVKGGVQLFKNLVFRKYASQAVAEQRAQQCEKCEFNVFPDKKHFMKFADNLAIMQVGERKTSNADKLGNCEVCTCVLKSKVFFAGKLDKFTDEEVVKLKSVKCWQLKLSGQDK